MDPVTRRSFLVRASIGVGAVGAVGAVGGASGLGNVLGDHADAAELDADEVAAAVDLPVMLHVRDAASGEVELLVADQEIVFTDRALVAKLLRAMN